MLKLGRAAFDPDKPRLRLSPYLTGTVTAPVRADWFSRVTSWPMDGNDQYGDCVWAEIAHEIQARTTYTGTPVIPTVAQVLKGYSDVTGFNPNDPSTDQGTNMADAMNYWRKTGLAGHKILAFASVDITNHDELRAAVAVFGAVALGIRFPKSAMDQFNAGHPWTVVHGSPIEGGHAIHLGEYDAPTDMWDVITWGAVQKVAGAFLTAYLDEAWVVITNDWLDATGHNPTGLDLYGLGTDFAALTGQPNPFPAPVPPTPTPAPTPVPVPTPAPGPPSFLVAAVQVAAGDPHVVDWLTRHHPVEPLKTVAARFAAILAAPRS